MKQDTGRNRRAIWGLVIGIVLIAGAAALYAVSASGDDDITWDVTLVGRNNEELVLSYKEIRDLPATKSRGGFFTTVGVVNGPFDVEGVRLTELCDLVGGVTSGDVVSVCATDGYSMVFDYKQLNGDIETYDAVTLHEVPHEKQLEVLLIYKQDGKTLTDEYGRPLRVAAVADADLLTEGHNWVKWVDRIEVIKLD